MSKPRLQTWKAFWPFYLGEHSLPATRWMHFVGSSIGALLMVWILVTGRYALIPLTFASGYAFAWVSHFFIEKNRPATFTYPLWSFAGDWVMWSMMLTFRLDGELKRLGITPKQPAGAAKLNA